jgi:hypothetical protein
MTKFILRYLGVMVSGFCIGFGRPFDPFIMILTLVSTLATMVSCITYWEMGRRDEEL